MSKSNKGRKKSGTKNNRDYEYDPVSKTHRLKPHVAAKRAAAHAKAKAEKLAAQASDERNQRMTTKGSPLQRAIERDIPIVNSNDLGPCCATVDALNERNEAMLVELRGTTQRAIDPVTLRADIIVVPRWFVRKHGRHMAHFRIFLRERKVRVTG